MSWTTAEQRVVARSSVEAEYRAIASGIIVEVISICNLFSELKFKLQQPPVFLFDNISAQCIAPNLVQHARTKHRNRLQFYT